MIPVLDYDLYVYYAPLLVDKMYIRVFLVDPEMSSQWVVWSVNVGLVMTSSTQSRSLRAALIYCL